jgi:hypothetical protein
MLKLVYVPLLAALVAAENVLAQERPLRNDTMIGAYACVVEHMAGIQREDTKARALVGQINPPIEKFTLTISRHTPSGAACSNRASGVFHQRCTSTFKAEMNPSVTNGQVLYGRNSNIFYDDVLAGYLWITSDQRFSAAHSRDFQNAYVKQGVCLRFENTPPSAPK